MLRTVGRTARRVHLLLVGGLALVGLLLLAMLVFTRFFSPDPYERDIVLLAALISAPVWILGLVAGAEFFSVIRGRRLSFRRALVWALVGLGAGVAGAFATGLTGVVVAVVTGAGSVGVDWPSLLLVTGSSAQYLDLASPWFWMPPVAIAFGVLSLLVLARDRGLTAPADRVGGQPPSTGDEA